MDVLKSELNDRKIELAIAPGQVADENMKSENLFSDRLQVVAGPRSKWLRQHRKITLALLANEPWLLPTGTGIASLIADAFRAAGVEPPRATVSARSPRLHDMLLASGRFLTVFPEAMMRLHPKTLPFKALPVSLRVPPRTVAIVTVNDRTLSPAAKLVIDCTREVAKSLAAKK